MIISLIAAIEQGGGIGLDGGIPWHLTDDLKQFRQTTMGHHLIMGRRTWESIGRVLPGREMLVLSRQADFEADGVLSFAALQDALAYAEVQGDEEAFVIGGAAVFGEALSLADRLYISWVQAAVACDTFFPEWEPDLWQVAEERHYAAGDGNDFAFVWQRLARGLSSGADLQQ